MHSRELARLQRFIECGNKHGDQMVREVASEERQQLLLLLEVRTAMDPLYITSVRKVSSRLMKTEKYEETFYSRLCSYLGERLEEPDFNQNTENFEDVVRKAAQRAFNSVHEDVCEYIHSCLDEIESDLERSVGQ